MNAHDKSEKRAREILQYYVNSVSAEFSDYIEAIILVGSLSNGSYIEGPGRDIDVITVLKDATNKDIRDLIFMEIDNIEDKFNKDIPIARTVYKLSELKRPFKTDMDLSLENKHLIEITTELQRIHESGILLYGRNIIEELPIPSRDEIIFFDELSKRWSEKELSKNPQMRNVLADPPVNILVQIIITTTFHHYYYATNKSCSNKHEIADRMRKDVGNYRFQRTLDIATKYKMNPKEGLMQKEYDGMKEEYQELMKWKDSQSVDAVPRINDLNFQEVCYENVEN
jgi:predicted nucleotidyltransferase